MLDEILKDKFVSGFLHGTILDRVCEEDYSKSLNDTLNVALMKETCVELESDIVAVNKLKANSRNYRLDKPRWSNHLNKKEAAVGVSITGAVFNNGQSKGCFACGKLNHDFNKCKYRSYKCKICQTFGHLAMCIQQNNIIAIVMVKEITKVLRQMHMLRLRVKIMM
ncbi:Zinc finger, CCHC-type [Cinara cedri]|uniref:Zinc finger, CCHC-type n=1 Tax=Cinara cedri TaxID=506608 RepID=A0A5E4N6M6_9HEMI|nr:Zinc finger, CCHC-type [Cinara cedri]